MPRALGGFDTPDGPSAEDALIDKAKMIRAKLREGGFSEVEAGRLLESFMRNYFASVTSEVNWNS